MARWSGAVPNLRAGFPVPIVGDGAAFSECRTVRSELGRHFPNALGGVRYSSICRYVEEIAAQ